MREHQWRSPLDLKTCSMRLNAVTIPAFTWRLFPWPAKLVAAAAGNQAMFAGSVDRGSLRLTRASTWNNAIVTVLIGTMSGDGSGTVIQGRMGFDKRWVIPWVALIAGALVVIPAVFGAAGFDVIVPAVLLSGIIVAQGRRDRSYIAAHLREVAQFEEASGS